MRALKAFKEMNESSDKDFGRIVNQLGKDEFHDFMDDLGEIGAH